MRIDPGLDACARPRPASVESVGTDLVELIRLDLPAVARLEELVDDDARSPASTTGLISPTSPRANTASSCIRLSW